MRPVLGREEPLKWIRLVIVAMCVPVQANAAVEVSNRKVRRVIAKADMSDAFSGVPEGYNLRQVIGLQQLAMTIREPNCQEITLWIEPESVWHQFLKDLHKMQGACVVVPEMEEAGIATHCHKRQ